MEDLADEAKCNCAAWLSLTNTFKINKKRKKENDIFRKNLLSNEHVNRVCAHDLNYRT